MTSHLRSVGDDFAPSDSNYFYVDLDVDRYKSNNEIVPYYEISTTEKYGDAEERDSPSNCEIVYTPPEDEEDITKTASDKTLICILDVPEFEFVVKDFHIVYNFPAGMCEYIETALPWHFNHPILPGPEVEECELPGGSGTGDDTSSDASGGTGYRNSECTGDNCCITEEEDLCPNPGGDPKCCHGGRKTDGSEWEASQECFGGPALIASGGGHSPDEFHRAIVSESNEDGLRETITLSNLIAINGAQSIASSDGATASGYTTVSVPFANYLKALDKSPKSLKGVSRSDLPPFLQVSSYDYVPQLFFSFSCLDSTREVLHKILLMIREWNTFEEFQIFYEDGGNDKADPDVEGEEGDECEYDDRATLDEEFEQCNDLLDLDDVDDCDSDRYPGWCNNRFNRGGGNNNPYPRIEYNASEPEGE